MPISQTLPERSIGAAQAEVERLLGWLTGHVLPLWLDHGVDWRRSGFHEHLDPNTMTCGSDFRRLRVLTRQIYVFSVAATAGVPGADRALDLGIEMLRHAREPDGGHPWRFDLDGRPIDATRDLYDHAFVLLAFSAAARRRGVQDLAGEGRATLSFIDRALRHGSTGYLESRPETRPRRQNPHMHLLEACLHAFETFGEPIFLERSHALATLLTDRFVDPRTGALAEYFHDDLTPLCQDGVHAVEPGHHFEWVWLLDRYARLSASAGLPLDPAMRVATERLIAFADHFGVSPAFNLVFDEVDSGGAVRVASFRLWPQAERIKCEAGRTLSAPTTSRAGIAALWRMIEGAPSGLWHERLDATGQPLPGPVPASSLYHLTCAITEAAAALERVSTDASGPTKDGRS
jgi:mannose-6-phosphate isomerase